MKSRLKKYFKKFGHHKKHGSVDMDIGSLRDIAVSVDGDPGGSSEAPSIESCRFEESSYKEVIREMGMDTDSLHDTTVSLDSDLGGSSETPSIESGRFEYSSFNKDVIREIGSDLIRLGLDLACCSEKLVNMNQLMMHVSAKESDFEAFTVDMAVNSAEAALEFDILSGFFDVEVKETDKFINELQIKYRNVSDVISSHKHLGEFFLKLEEKLLDAEKSLKQSLEQVSELMLQSVKFQRTVFCANSGETFYEVKNMNVEENGDFFNKATKVQISEEQEHILRMLEKSLARELDLDNKLTETMQTLDKMKRKLRSSQKQVMSAEEETAAVYARFLEADNASVVLMGISKELIGQLQTCQLNINSALCRESELTTKFQNCMQAIRKLEKEEAISQELAEKNSLEASVLKESMKFLEQKLKASEEKLVNDISKQKDIKALEEKVVIAESRAEKAEAESKLLSVGIKELTEELNLLKRSDISHEKFNALEKQLQETSFELQQAIVSVEAGQEKQSMLCSSIEDMEIVIDNLKKNVSSAEIRAEQAEYAHTLLEEANNELKMELSLVKANSIASEKFASLEKQLRNTDIELKQATAAVEASQERQTNMEFLIKKLNTNVSSAEHQAEMAERERSLLAEATNELKMELDLVKANSISTEKVASLEKQLRSTDIELQQATASVEASQEKQTMLCSSIEEMEKVVNKLKTNVLSAETRAEKAEGDCSLLEEANKELKMELSLVKANSIFSEKVASLEKQLRNTDIQLQQATASVEASQEKQTMLSSSIGDMEVVIEKLEATVLSAETRAEKAECECRLLAEANNELKMELDLVKANNAPSKKVASLEKQLRETDIQLRHATASVEASQEKQIMLCSSLDDMEIVIKKLEINVSSAESRVDKAETKCSLLEEANKELKMELELVKANNISGEKVASLEKHLRETDIQLQRATAFVDASQEKQTMLCSSIDDMETVIKKLEKNVSSAETRADKADCESSLLAEANKELIMELDLVKADNISDEKVASLEKQLRETDIQLRQATANVEASQEKQNWLNSSINDMQILIEKLESKVSEAEARTDSAEENCIILSESLADLNEELKLLRNKVESLEVSLQQAEETKISTSKDINIRTKVITDLVMQLALERERLQKQISSLMEDNIALAQKLQIVDKTSYYSMNHETNKTETETEEAFISSENHTLSFDTGRATRKAPGAAEVTASADDVINSDSNSDSEELKSKLETVRTIDAGRFTFSHILWGVLIGFIAVSATFILSQGNCPF